MKKIVSLLLLLVLVLSLSACQSGGSEPTPPAEPTPPVTDTPEPEKGPELSINDRATVTEYIQNGLSSDVSLYISDITVAGSDSFYIVVRTVAVGGSYIAPVAEAVWALASEKADELGFPVAELQVSEYSESNSSGVSNLIQWTTADGENGTFWDETAEGGTRIEEMTLGDLAALFE